ncbi:hypothetical protein E3T55_11565 [Cryobacterium frigoriphilum]|uniref:Uncharacterized protein n=1 Tax=Cryobacterium frigoriphilum TaxID=1259150 RepID=A0A4R8ZZB2_9MICO|nr:hypothetical protein [Cryobacterium frigoriphilum]TFD49291.1 hypothetical protein E3T55_11565 [Cryobacterium frigoriphilum]
MLHSANLVEEAAHDLACGTRAIDRPYDSYVLLGRLTSPHRMLAQAFEQLADWHSRVIDGVQYSGEDSFAVGSAPGVIRAELALRDGHCGEGRGCSAPLGLVYPLTGDEGVNEGYETGTRKE